MSLYSAVSLASATMLVAVCVAGCGSDANPDPWGCDRCPDSGTDGDLWLPPDTGVLADATVSDDGAIDTDGGADLAGLGASCDAATLCASGHCVDGVCCDSACSGSCEACVASATNDADGVCAPVRVGEDPADECAAEACSTGVCDGAGSCQVIDAGAECRAAVGPCDATETCDGVNPTCPPDVLMAQGVECRGAAGPCDIAETCDGVNTTCGADELARSGVVCRPAAGDCDTAEACTGASAACPDDSLVAQGTLCRPAAGDCDTAEACTGTNAACPADSLVAQGTLCRPAAGDCDVAESCSGTQPTCPANLLVAQGTTCRAAVGACDVAESCSGSSSSCPSDLLLPASTVCRPSAGPCDLAESCGGASADCPTDLFRPQATPCRDAANACDLVDFCTGSSAACVDGFLAGAVADCAPYRCLTTAPMCGGSCTTSAECAVGICESGVCVSSRRIFVTSTLHAADFGGLAQADAICQMRAQAASLPGTYKAWLSDGVTSAAQRLEHFNGPYYRVFNGVSELIANDWSDLTDGTIARAIVTTEFGLVRDATATTTAHVSWTGTTPSGAGSTLHCNGWTTTSMALRGTVGRQADGDTRWTEYGQAFCSVSARLYCVEQGNGI